MISIPMTEAPAGQNRKSVTSPIEQRKRRLLVPFVLPALLFYTVFIIGPTGATVWLSFRKWRGSGPAVWTGTRNYRLLLHDPSFRTAFLNTLVILIAGGIVVFLISFVIVMLIREMRFRKFVRLVIFFPNIVSAIVLSIVWGFLFSYDGVFNQALHALSQPSVAWLNPDNLFRVIVAGLVWINMGLYTTILLAGIDRIPKYFYEDCPIANASPWQRFRYVTLPMTWDVLTVAAILWTISALKIFEFIFAFGGSFGNLPPTSSWNSSVFIYGTTFGGAVPSYAFGYASASALVMLAVFGLVVVLLHRLMRREAVQF